MTTLVNSRGGMAPPGGQPARLALYGFMMDYCSAWREESNALVHFELATSYQKLLAKQETREIEKFSKYDHFGKLP